MMREILKMQKNLPQIIVVTEDVKLKTSVNLYIISVNDEKYVLSKFLGLAPR